MKKLIPIILCLMIVCSIGLALAETAEVTAGASTEVVYVIARAVGAAFGALVLWLIQKYLFRC